MSAIALTLIMLSSALLGTKSLQNRYKKTTANSLTLYCLASSYDTFSQYFDLNFRRDHQRNFP